MAMPTSAFDIPAAPILIPKGPWKEVDGCVCAPKGFKAQGRWGTIHWTVKFPESCIAPARVLLAPQVVHSG